ncbi:D binding [Daphnia sinensis]|uniref:D binding n=1 Tax=Daphnia sinensis TaxID=1820382 RepID=A0AAD5L429_9CRUS|nr:D binding [Daphnia sinensis]
MANEQEFFLRWNNHQSNLITAFHDLRIGEDFVDVTLACEGQSLQAHKVVLSACSPFFRDLLKTTPCKHPVIVLKDILFYDLLALVEFVYHGEVRVKHQRLPSFLRTAEVLKVRGLTESSSELKTYQLSENNSSVLRVRNNNSPSVSDSISDNDLISTQLGDSSLFSSGTENMGSDSLGHLANVKIEEVDLDSASDENDELIGSPETFQFQQGRAIATNGEERKEQQREEDTLIPPLLTLQSFARIPVSAAQDIAPPFNQYSNRGFSVPGHDGRRQQLETPDQNECEIHPGRTPGRMSTSDRPRWPCPFCMRLLSSRSSVRRHIEDRHTNDTSRHPCPLCERLYRTRNSLQYHLSTAHRDREPGPRGRPRTRPRSPVENNVTKNKSPFESEMSSGYQSSIPAPFVNLNRNPLSGNQQPSSKGKGNPSGTKSPDESEMNLGNQINNSHPCTHLNRSPPAALPPA